MTRHAWIKDVAVRQRLARVERLVRDAVADNGVPPPFHAQLLNQRSKRLRAAVMLLSARFGPDQPQDALDRAAAGLELLHEGTLYHDDIVDEAVLRRGEPTAQRAFGPAASAFAGSELLYATGRLFAGLPPPLRRSIGRAIGALCRGQLSELEATGDLELDERSRVRIMRDKTARLFALAARLGGSLSAAAPATLRHLTALGLQFGVSFQLADDLRDLLASTEELGRAPGSDLRDGVSTLPIVYALRAGGPHALELRACLREVQNTRDPDPASIGCCLSLIETAGGIRRAQATLDAWLGAARRELSSLPRIHGDAPLQSLEVLLERLRLAVPPERVRTVGRGSAVAQSRDTMWSLFRHA